MNSENSSLTVHWVCSSKRDSQRTACSLHFALRRWVTTRLAFYFVDDRILVVTTRFDYMSDIKRLSDGEINVDAEIWLGQPSLVAVWHDVINREDLQKQFIPKFTASCYTRKGGVTWDLSQETQCFTRQGNQPLWSFNCCQISSIHLPIWHFIRAQTKNIIITDANVSWQLKTGAVGDLARCQAPGLGIPVAVPEL